MKFINTYVITPEQTENFFNTLIEIIKYIFIIIPSIILIIGISYLIKVIIDEIKQKIKNKKIKEKQSNNIKVTDIKINKTEESINTKPNEPNFILINKEEPKINNQQTYNIQREYSIKINKNINNNYTKTNKTYEKKSLLTDFEKYFYNILKNNFEYKYIVQAQIPLNQIIEKHKNNNWEYANELNRTIDFGLFDKTTLEPILMIEINDKTHKQAKRYKRDIKVRNILNEANIPLLTFYASYPNKEIYIIDRINRKIQESR